VGLSTMSVNNLLKVITRQWSWWDSKVTIETHCCQRVMNVKVKDRLMLLLLLNKFSPICELYIQLYTINHVFIKSGVFLQRNETLLVEYKKLGRGNKIVDHRIGENDPTMSLDEKMVKRFALERQVRDIIIVILQITDFCIAVVLHL